MGTESGSQSDSGGSRDARSPTVAEALLDVRRLLGRAWPPGPLSDGIKVALRAVCASARRERMPPELLLIHLKDMLKGLPSADGHRDGSKGDSQTRLVAFVIDSYFAG
jgi:hypothetical protein